MSNRKIGRRRFPSKPNKRGRRLNPNAKAKSPKDKKYFGPKFALAALLFGMVIGSSSLHGNHNFFEGKDDIAIAKVKDIEGDEFEGLAPLYNDGELITLLEEGTIIFIDENVESNDDMYGVLGVSVDGETVQGLISSDYFDIKSRMSKERLKNYTHMYEVTGADRVNVRNATTLANESQIGTIDEGMQVIGGDRVVSKENEFIWIPVLTEDETGEFVEAYICQDYLKELDDMEIPFQTPSVRRMIVDVTTDTLQLRSSTSCDLENIIARIPDKAIVETTGVADEVSKAIKWTQITYEDENGEKHTGWVMNSSLKEYDLIRKKVNTNSGLSLNVHISPGLDSKKIADIENETVVQLAEFDLDSMKNVDGMDWVRIDLNDGTYGYVAYQYLEDVDEKTTGKDISDSELQKVLKSKRVNQDGKVIGMDISGMSPDLLREMLNNKNAVPSTLCRTEHDNDGNEIVVEYDTSDIAGKLDFVVIKIGARGYGEAGNFADNGGRYIEQAKVCEELGVPYGFYFYSTSLNETEADEEIKYVRKALSQVENRKYNIIPFVLDVENRSDGRLYGHDVTDVMAYWANQAEPVTGKVMLYGGAKDVANNSGERLIDLQRFNGQLVSGPARLWVAALRKTDDYTISYDQAYVNDIKGRDIDITITQTMLDGYNDYYPGLDIDIIDAEKYNQMLQDRVNEIRRSRDEDEYSGQEDNIFKKFFGLFGKDDDEGREI